MRALLVSLEVAIFWLAYAFHLACCFFAVPPSIKGSDQTLRVIVDDFVTLKCL